MDHQKRLSKESIRYRAKLYREDYYQFERYMSSFDSYIIENNKDNWASIIFLLFQSKPIDSEERKQLHQKIANDEI